MKIIFIEKKLLGMNIFVLDVIMKELKNGEKITNIKQKNHI
jgi:hypothetical protein